MSLQSWLMRTSGRRNHLWFAPSRWQTIEWNLWWLEIVLDLENSSYSLDAFLVYITSIVHRIYSRGIILFKKATFLILQHQEKKNTEIRCGRAVLLSKSLGLKCIWQKQLFIDVLKKRCAENLQQFYRRTLRNIELTLRHECSLVDLLQVFRTPFPKNTSGWLY